MSKVTIKNKKGMIMITNKLVYPETLNERVFNAIATGMLEGCLPLTTKPKRNNTLIQCRIQGLKPLDEYFQGEVTRQRFLDVAGQIAKIIKCCAKCNISENNLDLGRDRIFINELTHSVKCILWPVVNNQRSIPPQEFLRQLPFDCRFSRFEDNGYLERYASFFEGYQPFSINNFERMITQLKKEGEQRKEGENYPKPPPPQQQEKEWPDQQESSVHNNSGGGNPNEYDPFGPNDSDIYSEQRRRNSSDSNPKNSGVTGGWPQNGHGSTDGWSQGNYGNSDNVRQQGNRVYVFCEFCGNRNRINAKFCSYCGRKLETEFIQNPSGGGGYRYPDPEQGTVVLFEDSGGTTVLGYDEPPVQSIPTLTRVKNGSRVSVDRARFQIGSDRSCDLYIGDNTFISRNHADIVTDNGRYYILDRNSTNKTYVDGKVIQKGSEAEIFDGTKIKLANEEFVFNLT